MASRTVAQREWRLLSWWLATFHPNAEIYMNVRVGPTPQWFGGSLVTPATARMARVWNRWIDAIVIDGMWVALIEAKMVPDPGIFSQLVHYARLFRMDPEFEKYKEAQLNLVALVYKDDPSVSFEAPYYGVQWIVYQPALDDFVPPQLRQGFAGSVAPELPQDWPSRISLLTGKPLTIA